MGYSLEVGDGVSGKIHNHVKNNRAWEGMNVMFALEYSGKDESTVRHDRRSKHISFSPILS